MLVAISLSSKYYLYHIAVRFNKLRFSSTVEVMCLYFNAILQAGKQYDWLRRSTCTERVDGKERGLDTMHLYVTSRHSLSATIISNCQCPRRSTRHGRLRARSKDRTRNTPGADRSLYAPNEKHLISNTLTM